MWYLSSHGNIIVFTIFIDPFSYFVFMFLLILAFFACVVYFLFQNKWLCQMVEILNYQRIKSAYIGIIV
jgi:hypothetical protein